jgi:hypothetical protein
VPRPSNHPVPTVKLRCGPAEALGCGTNNGNVISQKIDAGGPVFTQGYAYDRLNRLKTMYEAGS